MSISTFVIPPHSPLQRAMRPRRPRVLVTFMVVLAAHVTFFGSLLIQGYTRGNPQVQPRPEILPMMLGFSGSSDPAQPGSAHLPDVKPQTIGLDSPAPGSPAAAKRTGLDISVPTHGLDSRPASPGQSRVDEARPYVVEPGDTLAKIAKKHSTTVQSIRAANELKSDRIIAGQSLRVPGPMIANAGK